MARECFLASSSQRNLKMSSLSGSLALLLHLSLLPFSHSSSFLSFFFSFSAALLLFVCAGDNFEFMSQRFHVAF